MAPSRRLVIWCAAALGASALLAGVLAWQHRYAQARQSFFMVGDPHEGARLFFEKDGCGHCHAVKGAGGRLAPDLGFSRDPQAGVNQLVTAMWNHAPRMWEQMRAEKFAHPNYRNQEMAHLFAFLHSARSGDAPRKVSRKGSTP